MAYAALDEIPSEAPKILRSGARAVRTKQRIARHFAVVPALLAFTMAADSASAGFLPLGDFPGGRSESFGAACLCNPEAKMPSGVTVIAEVPRD